MRSLPSFSAWRMARYATLAISLVGFVSACEESTTPSSIVGTWVATSFQVTQTGQSPMNVLAAGGSLSITIASDNTTSGTLFLPASVTGGSALNASMAGTAVQSGNTIEFNQGADTFVRDATWTLVGNTMQGTWTGGGTAVQVTLTRQ
jgi:hypothetical protein